MCWGRYNKDYPLQFWRRPSQLCNLISNLLFSPCSLRKFTIYIFPWLLSMLFIKACGSKSDVRFPPGHHNYSDSHSGFPFLSSLLRQHVCTHLCHCCLLLWFKSKVNLSGWSTLACIFLSSCSVSCFFLSQQTIKTKDSTESRPVLLGRQVGLLVSAHNSSTVLAWSLWWSAWHNTNRGHRKKERNRHLPEERRNLKSTPQKKGRVNGKQQRWHAAGHRIVPPLGKQEA